MGADEVGAEVGTGVGADELGAKVGTRVGEAVFHSQVWPGALQLPSEQWCDGAQLQR